jgi:hypothetical protein
LGSGSNGLKKWVPENGFRRTSAPDFRNPFSFKNGFREWVPELFFWKWVPDFQKGVPEMGSRSNLFWKMGSGSWFRNPFSLKNGFREWVPKVSSGNEFPQEVAEMSSGHPSRTWILKMSSGHECREWAENRKWVPQIMCPSARRNPKLEMSSGDDVLQCSAAENGFRQWGAQGPAGTVTWKWVPDMTCSEAHKWVPGGWAQMHAGTQKWKWVPGVMCPGAQTRWNLVPDVMCAI